MSSGSEIRQRNRAVIPLLVVAVAVILIAAVLFMQSGSGKSEVEAAPAVVPQSSEEVPESEEVVIPETQEVTELEEDPYAELAFAEERNPDDPLAAGPVDAPVALVIFSDYQCGYCAKWSAETLPTMMEYADDGKLRIEWRDVNIFGEDSERATSASYAAGLQGKFWEYHDALFAGGVTRSPAELSEEALTNLAIELGLDQVKFSEDMGAESTLNAVKRNSNLGLSLGVSSTPSFLVGLEPVVGAQPTDYFVQLLNQKLALAGS
ncbi:MAG: thioredoxin domain-containing protein [Scrofimicrobium sp.]